MPTDNFPGKFPVMEYAPVTLAYRRRKRWIEWIGASIVAVLFIALRHNVPAVILLSIMSGGIGYLLERADPAAIVYRAYRKRTKAHAKYKKARAEFERLCPGVDPDAL
jgi:hypothetical protein